MSFFMKKFKALAVCAVILGPSVFISCGGGAGEDISKVDLIPVQTTKEKWSLLAKDGSIKFEDEFKTMPSLVYNGIFSTSREGKYTIFKIDGDKYSEVGDLSGLYSAGYYEDGLIPVTFPKERISVYDGKGKKKFDLTPVNDQEVVMAGAGYSEGLLWF